MRLLESLLIGFAAAWVRSNGPSQYLTDLGNNIENNLQSQSFWKTKPVDNKTKRIIKTWNDRLSKVLTKRNCWAADAKQSALNTGGQQGCANEVLV